MKFNNNLTLTLLLTLILAIAWWSGFLKLVADEISFQVIKIFLILFAEGIH